MYVLVNNPSSAIDTAYFRLAAINLVTGERIFFKEQEITLNSSEEEITVLSDTDYLYTIQSSMWYTVNQPSLVEEKRQRCLTIDTNTRSLLAKGFSYQGVVFSLSEAAQLKWGGMYLTRASITQWPVTVMGMDDASTVSLANDGAISDFYMVGFSRVFDCLSGGVTLKQAVAAAIDHEALSAIQDLRV